MRGRGASILCFESRIALTFWVYIAVIWGLCRGYIAKMERHGNCCSRAV